MDLLWIKVSIIKLKLGSCPNRTFEEIFSNLHLWYPGGGGSGLFQNKSLNRYYV